jgi:hypothetical protein
MSRLPHFLDNLLADGSEVVSLACHLPFIPRKIPGTHFWYGLTKISRIAGVLAKI